MFKKSVTHISCRKYLLTSRMSPELKSATIPSIKQVHADIVKDSARYMYMYIKQFFY